MSEHTQDYNAQPAGQPDDDLRGGTQGGEGARTTNPQDKEGHGSRDLSSPSGGTHPEAPSRATPRTDVGRGNP